MLSSWLLFRYKRFWFTLEKKEKSLFFTSKWWWRNTNVKIYLLMKPHTTYFLRTILSSKVYNLIVNSSTFVKSTYPTIVAKYFMFKSFMWKDICHHNCKSKIYWMNDKHVEKQKLFKYLSVYSTLERQA